MLCGGVAACHRYGMFAVRCVECICWCMNFTDIKMHGTTLIKVMRNSNWETLNFFGRNL